MYLINHRLPENVIPINYELFIEPIFSNFTFEGTQNIQIYVKKTTNTIILNSKKLKINLVLFDGKWCNFTEDTDDEIIIINTNFVNIGYHQLYIEFSGILNDTMTGFYRSKSNYGYIATTQFEPTDARQAFPCFDEPALKATYDITIKSSLNKTVLSNTSIKYESIIGDKKITSFHKTPVMSSYLVAFIIGDLEYIETVSKTNVLIRSYATPGNKFKLSFSLEIASRALEWFNNWFDIAYPLNKLDLVAVPDFAAGAMENWGLIIFRENRLLYDKNTEIDSQQEIVYTICHEIAHQWFGNYVTMKWWTYLWLNESMATYFGWLVCDYLYPEWKIWNKFIDKEYELALELDGLKSSHPIEIEIEKSTDIAQIFDAISYSKGSCLIKFLANYLGEDKFRQGMRKYLDKHKYGITVSNDLWKSFDTNGYITQLMNHWIKQTGYPIICANNTNKYLTLSQSRYLSSGKFNDSKWLIPVNLSCLNSKTNNIVYLQESSQIFYVNSDKVLINSKRNGFYRVKYNEMPDINKLDNEDKIQVINDSFSLSLSGHQDFSYTFRLLTTINLINERDYNIWYSITRYLNKINNYLRYHKILQREYLNKIVKPLINIMSNVLKYSWNENLNKNINDRELNDLIIEELILIRNQIVIIEAIDIFRNNNWYSKKSLILPVIAKYGNDIDKLRLYELYLNNSDSQNVEPLLHAIGLITDTRFTTKTIDLINSNVIREQDLHYLFKSLSSNKTMVNKLWEILEFNLNKILIRYPPGSTGLIDLINAIGSGLITKEELEIFRNFFVINKISGSDIIVKQIIEMIENRILIINRILNDDSFKKLLA